MTTPARLAFTQTVALLFGSRFPSRRIEILAPLLLAVEGRRVDLEDLYRQAARSPLQLHDLIDRFADALVFEQQLEQIPLPLELVAGKILPRIQGPDFFNQPGREPALIAHQPFVNDTVIVYVIQINGAAIVLSIEQLIRWSIDEQQLDAIARRNLAAARARLQLRQNDPHAVHVTAHDGYDASRLLLHDLHGPLAQRLGREFLVAIPARDLFVAFPPEPRGIVSRWRRRAQRLYRRRPYPITARLFRVTRDGVSEASEAA